MKPILCFLLILDCCCIFPQTDYWASQVYFSGCRINHIPIGITIPDRDKKARMIINAIIDGCSYHDLQQKYPDSLDNKLEELISGKVIERNRDSFKLLFPVVVGENRAKLRNMIRKRMDESGLKLDTLIVALNRYVSGDPRMVFHLLWSRIIDDCWWNLYNSVFETDKGPPSIAFLVFPPHPYQCGTNSDYSSANDMFAFSWSYNLFNDSFSVPSAKSFFNLAENKAIPKPDRDFFLEHGLTDTTGVSLLFTYVQGDRLDSLCDTLKSVYINKIKGLFDYSELSRIFQIPAADLFIVAAHEVAYELIGMLHERNSVFIPIILKNNPELRLRYLVSVRFAEKRVEMGK